MSTECDRCEGTGKVIDGRRGLMIKWKYKNCPKCRGTGFLSGKVENKSQPKCSDKFDINRVWSKEEDEEFIRRITSGK